MDIIHKRFPVEEISIDELREKEDDGNESTFFERRLGLFCEMDTDAIGIKIDLSRLFKREKGDSQKAGRLTVKSHRKKGVSARLG